MRFLITIARKKMDIFLNWYFLYKIYVQTYCVCGFSALERGGRVGRLHVQSTIEIRCNADAAGVKMLRAHLRSKIPLPKGMDVVVGVQVLIEHDWAATTGYCMKDAGLPHYECEAHNMSPEFLEHCLDKYKRMKLTHEQGKELVTPNTFF